MKKFIFIFSLISLSQFITNKQIESKNLSETIKQIEGHLLYYYINENKSKVKEMLEQLLSLDENIYLRDKEIMEYWEYIDDYRVCFK